ncbi:shikimate dehydrogenase family protein [Halocola ammonii]
MKKFGLIGKSLSHSFSQKFFTEKWKKEGLTDHGYELYELAEIGEFKSLIEENEFSGLNVTIPYKESVIPFLDELSDEAEKIGAVNTIDFRDGKTIGHNTDVYGFRQSIKPFLANHHERALVLGTGGAAKAVAYGLRQLGIDSLFVSRTPEGERQVSYKDLNENAVKHWPLIVNATPLGTFPKVEEKPEIPYEFLTGRNLIFDLVYNPEETAFLKAGKAKGALTSNGINMLHLQAEKAWEIWGG